MGFAWWLSYQAIYKNIVLEQYVYILFQALSFVCWQQILFDRQNKYTGNRNVLWRELSERQRKSQNEFCHSLFPMRSMFESSGWKKLIAHAIVCGDGVCQGQSESQDSSFRGIRISIYQMVGLWDTKTLFGIDLRWSWIGCPFVITWKGFPRCRPFVKGFHQPPRSSSATELWYFLPWCMLEQTI